MKFKKKKPGLVKVGGDFTYPYELIKSDFLKLKERTHELGLKIYAGENRIRALGDSLTCCGIDGLEGFVPNRFNLNHILNGDKTEATGKMKEEKTGEVFQSLTMDTVNSKRLRANSFAYNMLDYYKKKKKAVDEIMGVDKR